MTAEESGRKGGKRRMETMTAEARSAVARRAAEVRWARVRQGEAERTVAFALEVEPYLKRIAGSVDHTATCGCGLCRLKG